MKIPVHYYIDMATLTVGDIAEKFANRKCFVRNEGGKTYLVEVI